MNVMKQIQYTEKSLLERAKSLKVRIPSAELHPEELELVLAFLGGDINQRQLTYAYDMKSESGAATRAIKVLRDAVQKKAISVVKEV